jgi:hypothetical protein
MRNVSSAPGRRETVSGVLFIARETANLGRGCDLSFVYDPG